MEHYDVIIIGTGAGGGTLAHRLAPSGKKILLIERGDYLRKEKDFWNPRAVFVDFKYKAPESWIDRDGRKLEPSIHYCVGGNTKFYGAALLRLRRSDFGEVRHHGGISPAWPISYEDLAPYYTQAEKLWLAHGLRGSDPTEPPADGPYPHLPVTHDTRIQQLNEDLAGLGLHPFPLPVGLDLDESDPRKTSCIKCDTCVGFPCLVDAKADSEILTVRPALAHPNVTLMTRTLVERLGTSASGREVTEVVISRDGQKDSVRGDIVVASCGAINSAILLLRSASDKHPAGLGNSSGVVGRHYMSHNNRVVVAFGIEPNPTQYQTTLGMNDYYHGSDDFSYPLGHIQMMNKSSAAVFQRFGPGFIPSWPLEVLTRHALEFLLISEDLPHPDNRVELRRDGGITLHHTKNNMEASCRLDRKLRDALTRIEGRLPRSICVSKDVPLSSTGHQNGTLRFGTDPKTSALDVHCKSHDLENLYVVDSSFFPSSGAVNPSLTVIANALRVGDHLLERLH